MKIITKLSAAALLLAVAGQASAATINIVGQIDGITVVGGAATTIQTYTPENPGLTGTFDDVSNAYTFNIEDYSLLVEVFFVPPPSPPGIGGTISVTAPVVSGDGSANHVVNASNSGQTCEPAASAVCTSQPTSDTLGNVLWNAGTQTGKLVTTLDGGALAGTIATTYSFSAVPAAVPVPAAAWLFGSALLGLGVVKRRKA